MPTTEDTQVRPIAAVLAEVDKGRVTDEASQMMHDLIAAVQLTGKAGKLQLTVTVKPGSKNAPEGVLLVTADTKVSVPRQERRESLFFVDGTGNLTRSNPQQPDLPLSAVPDAPAEVPGAQAANS